MINLEARNERYDTSEFDTMDLRHTTAVDNRMTDNQRNVAEALDAAGYLALWAHRKGEGFWIKGNGYMSLRQAAKLVNVKFTRKAI